MFGSVTRRKVCQAEAPSDSAASSSSDPCACISGISSRATKGAVTNRLTSTIAGTVNMSWTSQDCSVGPSRPCPP